MKSNLRKALWLACLLPAVSWAGAREEVKASIDKFVAARSYHAVMESAGPRSMRNEVDFVAPNRYHMRMQGLGDQYIVGDTMVMAIQGRTMRVPLPKGTLTQWRDPARLSENAANMTVTALGMDVVNGVPAKKYRVDHSKPQPSTMTLWVGSNGYPLQIITSAKAQGQTYTTTIRYSRIDDPGVVVNVPK